MPGHQFNLSKILLLNLSVMIDGLKIPCLDVNRETLRKNSFLKWPELVNLNTGEIDPDEDLPFDEPENYPFVKYQGLKFTDYYDRIKLTGSIHKYFNRGFHNYNDFGLNELIIALNNLKFTFSIDPDKTILRGLEIGVNIELNQTPGTFLNSLILHCGEPFTYQKDKTKRFRECSHVQYFIKAYDKGKQYKLKRYILRFEIKFIKMEIFNKQGIKTLSDLTKPANFEFLGRLLLQKFDEMLIGNLQADTSKLNDRDKILFANGHNPAYWETLIPKSENYKQGNTAPEYKRLRKQYDKKLNRFKELLIRTGADQLKNDVRELIVQKINQLSTMKKEGQIDHPEQIKKGGKLTDTKNTKEGQIDRLLYSVILPPTGNQKTDETTTLCCVTGMNISHQRKGSQYVSEKTIRNIYFTHPATFESLCKTFGTRKKRTSKEKQCYFIAHNIRNLANRIKQYKYEIRPNN